MLKRYHFLILTFVVVWGLAAAPALATPTGTCNTYNADVTEDGIVILYLTAEWGNAKFDDGHWVGFSYGLMDIFEIGGSWRLTADEGYRHDPVFDAKYRFDLGGEDKLTNAFAVGADNINFDEDMEGNIVPYFVYTHDFEGMRGHVGYAFEEDNGAIFVGFDSMAGDATFKWDWTQIDDGEDWMAAVGFDLPFEWFDDHWNLCMFLSWSSNDNHSDVWTTEVSYWLD